MKKLTPVLLPLSILFNTSVNSAEIEISINGNGTVNALEAATECSENCTIINDLAINTLQAIATSGKFTGWSGQQCDAGNGMLLGNTIETLGFVPDGAKTLASADINQDTLEDLAYISLFDGQVGFFINEGNGNFTRQAVAQDLNYPAALAVYDWDGDGDEDLIVTEYGANNIKLYSNDGNGSFSFTKDMRVNGSRPYAISVNDINQDNIPDIAISSFTANTSGNLSVLVDSIKSADTAWFINNGQDQFELAYSVSEVAAITIDSTTNPQNNTVDLVTAEIQSGDIAVYKYDAESESMTRKLVGNGPSVYGASFDDIDGNGTADVLTSHYQSKKLQLFYQQADGTFSDPAVITGFEEGLTATAFIDIDNNGYKDLVTGEFNNNKFVYVHAEGYRDCVVTSESKIKVTANFEQQASTPSSTSATTSSTSSGGSSGGASFLLSFFAFLILAFRKHAVS